MLCSPLFMILIDCLSVRLLMENGMKEVKLVKGRTSLREKSPELAAQWHPSLNKASRRTPDNTSYGSKKKVWWLGACGHEWEDSPNKRTSAGFGCPYCSGKRVLAGFNDLETLRPEIARMWHPTKNDSLTPHDVTTRSSKRVYWLCENEHEFSARVAEMTRDTRVHKCAICAGRKILPGVNDLHSKHPEIATQCANTSDMTLSPGSHEVIDWKCDKEGHGIWRATAKDRVQGHGCPWCSGRNVTVGVNDLVTHRPDLLAEWDSPANDRQPVDCSYGSHYLAAWVCSEEHQWKATVHSRAISKQGCPTCKSSAGERSLYDHVVSLLGDKSLVIHHDRSLLVKKELDIYVPSLNIAIEYNGLYWHSEAKIKDRNYHYNKWLECKKLGVQLIQVWEDEWLASPDIVKSMLAAKMGMTDTEKVSARDTVVRAVPLEEAQAFLNAHHIQGHASSSYTLGLYEKKTDTLVAVLCVKWTDKAKTTLDIVRFAASTTVRGGFTKLLAYCEKNYHPECFITFSDNCVSDGNLYRTNGFTKVSDVKPDYRYVVNNERKHKFGYRLKKFKTDPSLTWMPGLSERELAELNGLNRIWDAGKVKWERTCHKEPTTT